MSRPSETITPEVDKETHRIILIHSGELPRRKIFSVKKLLDEAVASL